MKIQLGETIENQTCTIEYFLHPEGGERGIVIVFPGGGYRFLAPDEGIPAAKKFVEMGFHAAVCMYRVAPVHFPVQLEDACNAVRYTREHAAELGVKPDKIAVMGFSAGGHLAGMVSNIPDSPEARPDASIFCYSVLSSRPENIHEGSFQNLLDDCSKDEYSKFSWVDAVHSDTPPAFLWHTMTDTVVPVKNSIDYALAMKKLNIDVELHIYPRGGHGLGLGNRQGYSCPAVTSWPELCCRFLTDRGW